MHFIAGVATALSGWTNKLINTVLEIGVKTIPCVDLMMEEYNHAIGYNQLRTLSLFFIANTCSMPLAKNRRERKQV